MSEFENAFDFSEPRTTNWISPPFLEIRCRLWLHRRRQREL